MDFLYVQLDFTIYHFYHIQTALTGNHICDVETMDRLDDSITFRVL